MCRKIIFSINHVLQWAFLKLIRLYQLCISPFLGNHCRFYPSCSQYAVDALTSYSIFKALFLIAKRLIRCNPLSRGGVDCI
ncbi:MAG: membrane protein insertion efficiency factor YidD [Gammaproteobacteria bacterium]|nr:membrane protein insertion efficiency factor YidD [Gammaproteobacteria bacterium]